MQDDDRGQVPLWLVVTGLTLSVAYYVVVYIIRR
jgi:hypothetical protein